MLISEYTLHVFFSVLQTFILYLYFKNLFKDKKSSCIVEKTSYILYIIIRLVIKLWLKVPLVMSVYIFFGILLLSFNYKSSFLKRIFYVSFIYLIFTITKGVPALIFPTYNPSLLSATIEYSFYASMTSQLLDLFILFAFMLIRKFKDRTSLEMTINGAMIYIPLSTLFVLTIIYEESCIPIFLKLICVFLALMLNFIVFYIFNRLTSYFESEWRSRELKQQTVFYENELNLIQNNFKNIRILKHDLQNHLSVIFGLVKQDKNEECIEYLEEINSLLSADKAIAKSGNVVIDSIINFKLYELERNQTHLSISLKIPTEINIPSFDIATIVGNLIDNAIDGAMSTSENRFISVSIVQNRGMLSLRIQNSFDGVIKKANGKIFSRKRDFASTGTGMERVSRVIHAYNGLLEYDILDSTFTVKALLYIPQ